MVGEADSSRPQKPNLKRATLQSQGIYYVEKPVFVNRNAVINPSPIGDLKNDTDCYGLPTSNSSRDLELPPHVNALREALLDFSHMFHDSLKTPGRFPEFEKDLTDIPSTAFYSRTLFKDDQVDAMKK
jgi:hypothetical protein